VTGARELPARLDPAGREVAYLHPGRLIAAATPTAVTTVLGSCVAVCLFDVSARVGGIGHAVLPKWPGTGVPTARYADFCVRMLAERLLALGARRGGLRAKVFGGACVLPAFRAARDHLGTRNVDACVDALADEGIEIVGGDVGGDRGRKLDFHIDDGAAWVRRI
jgi:chemotaxis protein CheD